MKTALRLMQIMMVVVIAFVGFQLVQFFLESGNAPTTKSTYSEGLVSKGRTIEKDPAAPNGPDGKTLFSVNCASCHKLDRDLVGPALMGVQDRWPDKKLLYSWIRNNQDVLKSGDLYANELYKKWNKTAMNLFPSLTDAEITAILKYLRQYMVRPVPEVVACL